MQAMLFDRLLRIHISLPSIPWRFLILITFHKLTKINLSLHNSTTNLNLPQILQKLQFLIFGSKLLAINNLISLPHLKMRWLINILRSR